eukprot:Partr_v1_DN24730_c0_g1_i1_m37131 putative serine threonine-protein kinase
MLSSWFLISLSGFGAVLAMPSEVNIGAGAQSLFTDNNSFGRDSSPGYSCNIETLSRYEFVTYLGQGNNGVISAVRDKCDGKEYALKNFGDSSSMEAGSYINETTIMEPLGQHENIVPFTKTFVDNNIGYALMPIMLDNLEKFQDPVPPAELKSIVRQLLEALKFIHSKNVIHSDVKPGNILIESMMPLHVRLADFGLAQLVEDIRPSRGTRGYIPAEKILGLRIGNYKSDDIWALGVIMLELSSGSRLRTAVSHEVDNPENEQFHANWDLVVGRVYGYGRLEPEFLQEEEEVVRFYLPTWTDRANQSAITSWYCRKFNLKSNDCRSFKSFMHEILQRNSMVRATADELLRHSFLRS